MLEVGIGQKRVRRGTEAPHPASFELHEAGTMRQNTHGNMEPSEPDDWNCSVDLDDVLKALYDLAHADALEGVLPLVAGWNGPADKPYAPHPPQLGAQIKTTCGRVYKLAEAIKQARDVLYRANVVPKQTA